MQYLLEYYQYLVVATALALLITGYYTLVSVNQIKKYFSNKRFKISSNYEVNPVTLSEDFIIRVFNNNINDTRVVAIGVNYKNRNIDYFNTYLKQNNLGEDSKIVIPSRDSMKLIINCNELKKIIRDLNNGKADTTNIKIYVIDSLGITTTMFSESIRKNIVRLISKDITKEAKQKLKEQQRINEEKMKERLRVAAIKSAERKEKLNNLYMRIKSKIKK